MLKEVTSLFDYFNKCKQDKHYKRVVIMAYRHHHKTTVSFIKAKDWIDRWIESTVMNEKKGTGFQTTCLSMTEFLNRFVRRMNQASISRLATVAEANRLTRMGEGTAPAVVELPER